MATKTLPPVHPGEVLLEDFMKPLGLSQYRVAMDIGVQPLRISQQPVEKVTVCISRMGRDVDKA